MRRAESQPKTPRDDAPCDNGAGGCACAGCAANSRPPVWIPELYLGLLAGTRRRTRYRRERLGSRHAMIDEAVSFGQEADEGGARVHAGNLVGPHGFRYELRHCTEIVDDRRVNRTEIAIIDMAYVDPESATVDADSPQINPPRRDRANPAARTEGHPRQGLSERVADGCGVDKDGCRGGCDAAVDAGRVDSPTWTSDSGDLGPCEGGRTSVSGGLMGWLSDVRGALGVEQFRHAAGGRSFEGARASGRNGYGRQAVALHDHGIPSDWTVLSSGSTSSILDGYSWNCCRDTGTVGWGWIGEMPPMADDQHATSMAAVMVANGREDDTVSKLDHTGMAPSAGVVVLGPDTTTVCGPGTACIEDEDMPGTWDQHAGPQAVQQAQLLGMDLFVSALSVYQHLPDPGPFSHACHVVAKDEEKKIKGKKSCNDWNEDELMGVGAVFAAAIDGAFVSSGNSNGLLALLSSGNRSALDSSYQQQSCVSGDLLAASLGRSSYTSLSIGVTYTQLDCGQTGSKDYTSSAVLTHTMTVIERSAALQAVGYWLSGLCSNSMGPTRDGLFYPLLLGYAGMCGVASPGDWCLEAPIPIDDLSYSSFSGSSAATASVGGAATVLKEWLEDTYGHEDGGNPALLRTHLLNMGDRSGAFAGAFADRGLPRHTGFGKLQLRLVEGCHFNDGVLDYRAWTFLRSGEAHIVPLGAVLSSTRALPTDLARIHICVWFHLQRGSTEEPEDTETSATSRPLAFAYLQRRGVISSSTYTFHSSWDTVLSTYTGDEYISDAGILASSRPVVRDPHMNLFLDQDDATLDPLSYGSFNEPDGDYEYRLIVWAAYLPTGPVTTHCSILWETGSDPSLAKNRTSWRCPTAITVPLGPLPTILERGRDKIFGSESPAVDAEDYVS